jgi:hypothetical protein
MFCKSATRFVVVILAALLGACVDAPNAPESNAVDSNPLATSFDGLAQEQEVAGDVDRGEEFRWAALAVRTGVTPTRFDVSNDGQRETYDAFVHSVDWIATTLSMRPVGHRTFVAWRKNDDAMQVIIVSTHTEVAPVLHPYSMRAVQPGQISLASLVAGASAAYFERGASQSVWVGTSGQVRIRERSVGGACSSPAAKVPPRGIKCEAAVYGVGFEITLARTRSDKSRTVEASAATKKLVAPDQATAGAKLTFSCVLPLSDEGCR